MPPGPTSSPRSIGTATRWAVGPTWAEVKHEQAQLSTERAADDPIAGDTARMRRDALTLFARPGIARARELMPLAAHWRPDVVVHELTEAAGWEAAAVSGALDVVHGFGTHVPYLIDLAGLIFDATAHGLGTPNRTGALLTAPYVDPCPPILQPPGEQPFTSVRPLRPEVGAVYPGDTLPAEMRGLPYEKAIYLTLGTVLNAPELLATAIDAVRDLPHHVIITAGPGVDPSRFGAMPEHIAIASFVPQVLIMEHSAAVVSHTRVRHDARRAGRRPAAGLPADGCGPVQQCRAAGTDRCGDRRSARRAHRSQHPRGHRPGAGRPLVRGGGPAGPGRDSGDADGR